ncbi:hypothetical protein [Paenibacillus thalictri]|uniref:Uncharacterized protein n=1 Tax=Paenibacillus thalictri TaxID=2527873 RepID=A0A4Q9DU45_9BACL|nr:hypothetical protein [Paenibacillus thalictri]TBL79866.1 hypothetical protein EYB31_09725 [Paenibacillus thalictri]
MRSGDGFVILLILIGFAAWLFVRSKSWVHDKVQNITPEIPVDEAVPEDDVVRLLVEAGYEVLSGKKRIPIHITLNETEQLQSRLFIDYFAQKEDDVFIVKLARDRKPMDMTGSGIRDALLCYQLLYPQSSGILYVEPDTQSIRTITFETEV